MGDKAVILSRLRLARTLLHMYQGYGDVVLAAATLRRIDELLDAYNAAKPERCAVCRSAEVVYHNYRGTPLCCPCAECCPPKVASREGRP